MTGILNPVDGLPSGRIAACNDMTTFGRVLDALYWSPAAAASFTEEGHRERSLFLVLQEDSCH